MALTTVLGGELDLGQRDHGAGAFGHEVDGDRAAGGGVGRFPGKGNAPVGVDFQIGARVRDLDNIRWVNASLLDGADANANNARSL